MADVWAIDGGNVNGQLARTVLFKSTSGRRGVTLPGDLKVTALPTPGNAVRIAKGGGTIPNDYAPSSGQSYGTLRDAVDQLTVPATGSSGGAVRYVIQKINDPQYPGVPAVDPKDPDSYPYDPFVLVNSIDNLAYPNLPLARINQPANTATITNAMITDLRRVAKPQTERELYLGPAAVQNLTSSTFVKWPSYEVSVPVPEWANWVKIIAHVNGAQQMAGKTYGEVRLNFGTTLQSGTTSYDINSSVSVNDGARLSTIGVVLSAALPANYRGTNQALRVMANKLGGALDPGYLRADAATHIEYDVWFQEVAD